MNTTTHTWTPATYRIAREHGDDTITGVTCGAFGVGPSVTQPERWQVTHLPSGCTCGPTFARETGARRLAEALIPLRDDWHALQAGHTFDDDFRRLVRVLAERIAAEERSA